VPVDAGYEQVVAALGRRPGGDRLATERDRAPRQFIFGDGAGGVERIRVDFSGPHLEHLCTVLDTTPDAQRRDAQSAAAAAVELLAGADTTHTGREAMAARAEARPPTAVSSGPEFETGDVELEAVADAELGLGEVEPASPAESPVPAETQEPTARTNA
jgi:hypothetical protein